MPRACINSMYDTRVKNTTQRGLYVEYANTMRLYLVNQRRSRCLSC